MDEAASQHVKSVRVVAEQKLAHFAFIHPDLDTFVLKLHEHNILPIHAHSRSFWSGFRARMTAQSTWNGFGGRRALPVQYAVEARFGARNEVCCIVRNASTEFGDGWGGF